MNAATDFDDLAARMERGLTTVADVDLLAQLRARLLRYELALVDVWMNCTGVAEQIAAEAINGEPLLVLSADLADLADIDQKRLAAQAIEEIQ